MRKVLIIVGIVAIASVLATSAFAQGNGVGKRGATFTPLGLWPMCTPTTPPDEFCDNFPYHTITDTNAAGDLFVGMHAFFSGNYLWTEDLGRQTLGPVGGAPWLGRTNNRIASTYFDDTFSYDRAAHWVEGFWPNTVWDRIPVTDGFAPCGGSGISTFGASDNYDTGLTWTDRDGNGNGCEGASAYAWSEGTGTYILDRTIAGENSSRGNAIANDGNATGWTAPGRTAAAWIDGTERYICGDIADGTDGWFCNEGWDITPSASHILYSGAGPEDFNVRAQIVEIATGNNITPDFPPAPGDPFWDTLSLYDISEDGKTAVGEFGGGGFFGSPPYPVMWVDGIGTIDLQIMLLGQGLDDLFFWFLSNAGAVNADGTIIGGYGLNPDGWFESWVVDVSRIKVCHKPGDGNERTLSIGWDGVADHLAHGDVLATCEFAASDAASRFATRRQQASTALAADQDTRQRSLESARRILAATGGNELDSTTTSRFGQPTAGAADELRRLGTPEQRRQSIQERLGKRVDAR